MLNLQNGLNDNLRKTVQTAQTLVQRSRRVAENIQRRIQRKPRTVTESPNLLPLLIQVLAAFSKSGGEVLERRSIPRSASSATTTQRRFIPNCESSSARR
jgi:hypothetical protein